MKSKVYFMPLPGQSTPQERHNAIKTLCTLPELDSIPMKNEMVAVKVHVGEKKNTTYIKPGLVKPIIEKIKRIGALPFLTETSTLYKGERSNAVDHINCAYSHGFTPQNVGTSFIMADGLLGNTELEVDIQGRIFQKVHIAREVVMADALIVLSHATGHIGMGFGGALKNMGMGLASRKGKLRQHSSIKPYVDKNACTFCKKCMRWCPENAIIAKKDFKEYVQILEEKCIGCGECLTVCNYSAVHYNWGTESANLQRNMVEHVLGVLKNKRDKCFFINFLIDMTLDCDCINKSQDILIPDIGICASTDPVAIDQASIDLTEKRNGKHIGLLSYPHLDPYIQVEHAADLGLGNRDYELEEISR
ncbi:MAG: DUF362 domain-containing protein [Spirochaetales bacterium]|nr:DUF362 domain-containing protein [Spirochaetales bacterium]